MAFDLNTLSDPSIFSLMLFALCFIISSITSNKGIVRRHTARVVRSEYRRSWVEWALVQQDPKPVLDVFRNNIMVSSSILGGLVIAFGLLANSSFSSSGDGASIFILLLIALMTNALFRTLMEIRALTYFPILFGTSEELIKKNEKMSKIDYISKFLDHAYDDFSDTIRSLFFIIALLVFPFDKILFMAVTIAMTYLFVRRDISEKSRLEIF